MTAVVLDDGKHVEAVDDGTNGWSWFNSLWSSSFNAKEGTETLTEALEVHAEPRMESQNSFGDIGSLADSLANSDYGGFLGRTDSQLSMAESFKSIDLEVPCNDDSQDSIFAGYSFSWNDIVKRNDSQVSIESTRMHDTESSASSGASWAYSFSWAPHIPRNSSMENIDTSSVTKESEGEDCEDIDVEARLQRVRDFWARRDVSSEVNSDATTLKSQGGSSAASGEHSPKSTKFCRRQIPVTGIGGRMSGFGGYPEHPGERSPKRELYNRYRRNRSYREQRLKAIENIALLDKYLHLRVEGHTDEKALLSLSSNSQSLSGTVSQMRAQLLDIVNIVLDGPDAAQLSAVHLKRLHQVRKSWIDAAAWDQVGKEMVSNETQDKDKTLDKTMQDVALFDNYLRARVQGERDEVFLQRIATEKGLDIADIRAKLLEVVDGLLAGASKLPEVHVALLRGVHKKLIQEEEQGSLQDAPGQTDAHKAIEVSEDSGTKDAVLDGGNDRNFFASKESDVQSTRVDTEEESAVAEHTCAVVGPAQGVADAQQVDDGSLPRNDAGERRSSKEKPVSRAEFKKLVAAYQESNPTSAQHIPLEARTWSAQQLQMFLMSNGEIRPRGCSISIESNRQVTMVKEEISMAVEEAAQWIAEADALLVGSGAGMGADSGLATFRGSNSGVWPALKELGMEYEEICRADWFEKDPRLAWGFWNHCLTVYRGSMPHAGYETARNWGRHAPFGAFSFTSNIDSHWETSGWRSDRLVEVHGAASWLQCSQRCSDTVWQAPEDMHLGLLEDEKTHRVHGDLPTCMKCGALARPAVLMFGGDKAFATKGRRNMQVKSYDSWLQALEKRPDAKELRLICLEIGCGLVVPTVRKELQAVLKRFPAGRLIRVNLENAVLERPLQGLGTSLPLTAGDALRRLKSAVTKQVVVLTVWNEDGFGIELCCSQPLQAKQIIRRLKMRKGVVMDADVDFLFSDPNSETDKKLGPEDVLPRKAVKDGRASVTVLGRLSLPTCSKTANRIHRVVAFLDTLNSKFGDPDYQAELNKAASRSQAMELARRVQYNILPKHGFSGDESGILAMQTTIGFLLPDSNVRAKVDLSMQLAFGPHNALSSQNAKRRLEFK